MSILVIGGTGTLGRQIVKQALDEGYQVKCLVRDFRRGAFLKDWGAELIYGDLSIPSTIPTSLKGVTTIIDSATIRSTSSYTSETIDWRGKLALLEAAKLVGIKKFIYFSVLNASKNPSIPLLSLKLKMEKKLEASGLNYTIFQCSGFFQGLISQYALPILENETIWLPGNSAPVAYLDTQDAAKAVVQSLGSTDYDKKTVSLIGEKFWTSKEIVELCERLSGKTANISYIPFIAFSILRRFFRLFEFTWNIADRLQFGEIADEPSLRVKPTNEIAWSTNRLSLESYLQEYFGKILKKLRETNYQQSQKSNEISFL
jgi:uncharacterized protein YbjT (DUF2867 family)|tara:strand:+ start:270 stop:1217 length:948 start_codon:yes stop_codon:yes gene_type:complete